ncbi:alpha-ketoglutarate-dependent dioxygenase AlkB [Limibacter armeniacum]|uniref:alpha-ketoglutarate-dependent dioxygenase AlkB family protein n=1 Tax=Limibacter armeniacum TaxID=466084 RepID=UPI002FE60550
MIKEKQETCMQMDEIKIRDGVLFYDEHFYKNDEADQLYQLLENEIEWEQEELKIFGKWYKVPRKTAWYADKGVRYKYSGVVHEPIPWTAGLLEMKAKIEAYTGHSFNSVLLNWYRNGSDKMGWHADNESELGENPIIASLSFGETRRFDLRYQADKTEPKVQLHLAHGSLLIMGGTTQHFWQHQIPVQKKIEKGRINLTFRLIKSRT